MNASEEQIYKSMIDLMQIVDHHQLKNYIPVSSIADGKGFANNSKALIDKSIL